MIRDETSASSNVQIAFDDLVARNVEAIHRIERAAFEKRSVSERITDAVAHFCGTRAFLFLHAIWFGGWLFWNGSSSGPKRFQWDPAPFNYLALAVGLEAIFMTALILMKQNREQRVSEQRNHLDLQINMLAEQENSLMLGMMRKMMEHFHIPLEGDGLPDALEQATDAERLAEQIEEILEVTPVLEELQSGDDEQR